MIAASVAAAAAGIAALVSGAAIYYVKCYRDNQKVKVLQAKLDHLTIKVEGSKSNVNRAGDSSAISLQPNRLFEMKMEQEMNMVNLFALRSTSGDVGDLNSCPRSVAEERSRSAKVLDGRIRAKQNGPMHSAGQYQIPVLAHGSTTRQHNAAI